VTAFTDGDIDDIVSEDLIYKSSANEEVLLI